VSKTARVLLKEVIKDGKPLEGSKKKEILEKLERLNSRISELKTKSASRELLTLRGKSVDKTYTVDLDFIDSDKLTEVEKGLRETIRGVFYSRMVICRALANIDRKKLYIQAGTRSFLKYLESGRIPLKYKTAKEYAKIGNVLLRHAGELKKVGFSEEHGLKKLIYLDKAIETHINNPNEVYRRAKESNLTEFKTFAEGDKSILKEESIEKPCFRAEHGVIYKYTSNGDKKAVLSICDKTLTENEDSLEFQEYMEKLRKSTESFYLFLTNKG